MLSHRLLHNMRAQPCSRSRRSSRLSARTTAYPNPALSIPSNSADPASFPSLEDITIQSRFLASCPHSMLSDEEVGASRLLQLDFFHLDPAEYSASTRNSLAFETAVDVPLILGMQLQRNHWRNQPAYDAQRLLLADRSEQQGRQHSVHGLLLDTLSFTPISGAIIPQDQPSYLSPSSSYTLALPAVVVTTRSVSLNPVRPRQNVQQGYTYMAMSTASRTYEYPFSLIQESVRREIKVSRCWCREVKRIRKW